MFILFSHLDKLNRYYAECWVGEGVRETSADLLGVHFIDWFHYQHCPVSLCNSGFLAFARGIVNKAKHNNDYLLK